MVEMGGDIGTIAGMNSSAYEESGKIVDQLYEVVGITEKSFSET